MDSNYHKAASHFVRPIEQQLHVNPFPQKSAPDMPSDYNKSLSFLRLYLESEIGAQAHQDRTFLEKHQEHLQADMEGRGYNTRTSYSDFITKRDTYASLTPTYPQTGYPGKADESSSISLDSIILPTKPGSVSISPSDANTGLTNHTHLDIPMRNHYRDHCQYEGLYNKMKAYHSSTTEQLESLPYSL